MKFKDQIEIENDVPGADELAAQFAKAAKVSDDGNKIEVGKYTAKRRGFWSSLFYFAGMGWQVESKQGSVSLEKGRTLLADRKMTQFKMIELLSEMEARDQISEAEKKKHMHKALQEKLWQQAL